MSNDWVNRLRTYQDSLTRAERLLVDYVNEHPDLAVHMTQRNLAEESGVSKPVIISCFRKLGFETFHDFQTSIEQFFATQIDSLVASRRVQDRVTTIDSLVREAGNVDVRSIERLMASLDVALLEQIAHRIHDARTVFVMGPSTGRYPAHYLAQRLPRYGKTALLVQQDMRHVPDMLHLMTAEDVLIMFHYSDDDQWLSRTLHSRTKGGTWTALVSAVIHPTYVDASDVFIHVPRGEMEFKNSMAVPMHYANLLLLTYELLFRAEVDAELIQLESTRRVWSEPVGKT